MPPKKQTKASSVASLPKRPSLPTAAAAEKPSIAHELPELAQDVFGYDQGSGYGVRGESDTAHGVHGEVTKGCGVYGRVNTTPGVGVQGVSARGGYAVAGTIESGSGVGVFGYSRDGSGVWGESVNGWAGRFSGSVSVSGNTNVGGNLGIGTTQPEAKLDVRGSASIAGNVGIGTTQPTAQLDVHGDVKVTGDVFLTGADCAEEFAVKSAETIEPGTVLVIADDGSLQPSESPYDRRVAGIVSGAGELKPGITLGRKSSRLDRLPVGLAGRAYCKVDAAYGPIEIGDLLTTSPTPGHAMKAADVGKAFGSVLGKALRQHKSGTGMVPVLIALQ